jgi:transposase
MVAPTTLRRRPPQSAFDHGFDAVLAATAARDRLDEQIMVVAASPRFADPVNRLGCLRGVSALTGLALTVEIGDWSRFTGSSIGAYVGLVPSEYSSGTLGSRGRSPRRATPMYVGC